MKIKYFGHACFMLTSGKGTKVLIDPVDEESGYKLPQVAAHIVTTSHDHHDHSNVSIVEGKFEHIKSAGTFEKKDIVIKGTQTFHDEREGAERGNNIVFTYSIDNINVCHLGDLGHIPTDRQILEIGEVDILLTPVGGIYTVDYKGALRIMEIIKPKITIPMHYKTETLSFQLDGVEKFLSGVKWGKTGNEIEMTKSDISKYPGVLAMDYM
jgi:L-ascorbate metabolism protein UlaG (beta-lactamase superfamily)